MPVFLAIGLLGVAATREARAASPPALILSTHLGGAGEETGGGIAVDPSGSIYVTGSTDSIDFPVAPNALQRAKGDAADAFVAKLSPDGSQLLYSTYFGAEGFDRGDAIAVDASGSSYVTGMADGDAFVMKLNPTGDLVYTLGLGGTGDDEGLGIAIDAAGAAYVTGQTMSADFPTTPGAFRPASTAGAAGDGFAAKIDPSGTVVYATYLGAAGSAGRAIAVDAAGDAYITGSAGKTFPTTRGAFQTAFGGGASDAFVAKLNPTGTAFLYSTLLGGADADAGYGIAVDSSGAAYVTGTTPAAGFPTTPGALQAAWKPGDCTPPGEAQQPCSDSFAAKISPDGSSLVFSTYLGGSGSDEARAIALDAQGDATVAGATTSADFPVVDPLSQRGGAEDVFVSELNASGTALLYSTTFGGGSSDGATGVALGSGGLAAGGQVYMTGTSTSDDLPVTAGAYQTALNGPSDAFVMGIGPAPAAGSGDVNGDGKVNIADATLVLQYAVGLATPSPDQLAAGDMNGDGKITIADATLVLAKAVGL